MCNGWRLTAHTKASETPVLPPVYSTTGPRAGNRPSASAASIMASAMRSFMLPVGFALSSFSRMRAPLAGKMLPSSSSGVPPIQSRIPVFNGYIRLLPMCRGKTRNNLQMHILSD